MMRPPKTNHNSEVAKAIADSSVYIYGSYHARRLGDLIDADDIRHITRNAVAAYEREAKNDSHR